MHAHRTGLLKPNPRRGEKNHWTKLTDIEALEIRQTYIPYKFNKSIFMKYSDRISKSGFNKIARGEVWKHLNI